MLLTMLAALNTRSPIENFLLKCVELQTSETTGTLSLVQMCIMHELATAARKYRDGVIKSPEVPLQHFQEKYKLERYTVSRNAIMLGKGGVQRRNPKTGRVTNPSIGKKWVAQPKKGYEGSQDERIMSLILTKQGERIAEIMFNK